MLYGLYQLFARINAPLWRMAQKRRLARGKEDPARLGERSGISPVPRPKGKVIWLHALSVGESLALLALMRRVCAARTDVSFVLTTNTRTSVEALEKIGLPPGVIHQYLPSDARGPAERFLDHWRPDLVAFAELDLWPYLLAQVQKRGLPSVLLNARVTDRTWAKRRWTGGLLSRIVQGFDLILTQEATSTGRFRDLGAQKVETLASLKSAAAPLPDLPEARAQVETQINGRPVWLALSTSVREEDQLIAAHQRARKTIPNLLLILAPRHIKAADRSEELALLRFPATARRSRGDQISPDTAVYIADTFGETGLWARVAPVTFVGHSMPVEDPALTGKNPYEPMALGSAVIHGPDLANFRAIYDRLRPAGATRQVGDTAALADALTLLLTCAEARRAQCAAAAQILAHDQSPLVHTAEALLARL